MKTMSRIIISIFLIGMLSIIAGCACEHEFGEWTVKTEPTCAAEGVEVRVCSKCEAEEEQAIEMLEHKFGEWEITNEPTCTSKGTEAKTCADCGAKEERDVELVPHTFDEGTIVTEATCTDVGKTTKTCTACGITEDVEIPANGHSWNDATCMAPKTCSVCSVTEGDVIDHSYSPATCTAPATCNSCGVTEGEALGHNMSSATCTAPATCNVCGATDGEALGHQWSGGSCTSAATCSTCGETSGTPSGHNPGSDFKCANCGSEMTAADYKYLAASDFRGIKSDYSSAEPVGAYINIYTDSTGDKCVMTWVWYKIRSQYSQQTLHNLTTGQTIEDPVDYYDRLASRYVGATKLAIMEVKGDALGALASMKTKGTYIGPEELY